LPAFATLLNFLASATVNRTSTILLLAAPCGSFGLPALRFLRFTVFSQVSSFEGLLYYGNHELDGKNLDFGRVERFR
jgi:hypothetical protein